mmetsp:Transcript_14144/g.43261  ORF Transcript_14144/g.43261 Transcript_14144/m.43261 type:complete len:228 (+) Transcript_14144:3074-3757(+)
MLVGGVLLAMAASSGSAIISAADSVEADPRRKVRNWDDWRRPSQSGRLRSRLCLAALRAAFSASAASTSLTAAAISAATRASASAFALAIASATAASLSCASSATLRAASSASLRAASSASLRARSAASAARRSWRASDHLRYSRLALIERSLCCARAAAARFSLYFLRTYHPWTVWPMMRSAPFLRFDSAILRTRRGTTTAVSMVARSSRKPPQPALRNNLVSPSA